MRTATLFLLIVLLAVPGLAETAADNNVVVPGVRAGKWTLKMTLDQLEKMNGPAVTFETWARRVSEGSIGRDFRQRKIFTYGWESLDFAVDGYEPRKIKWMVVGYRGVVAWRTEKGIRLQVSTRADILEAYGKPTAETVPQQGQTNVIYDAIGIAFEVYDGGTLDLMNIFPPGTARSIWKF